MNILEAIVLGIVQGITEFLPVSSSGHLVLLQQIFGVEGNVLFFDTLVHVGTLVAVMIVFWQDIVCILKKPIQRMTGLLIVATIPAVAATLLLGDHIDAAFEGQYLAYGFLATSVVLVLAEIVSSASSAPRKHNKPATLGYPQAITAGCMQALAILPGLSRSGSTLAGSLLTGVDRNKGAHFAFFMSVPVIIGSVVYQGYDVVKAGAFDTGILLPSLVGMVFAGASGYFAIRFMLNLIRKHKLYGFAIYTGILGVLVLLDQLVFHLVF